MRAMRVIYYRSIMKISLPLDIVSKHAVPDTPGGHCRRHQLAPPSGRGAHLHAWHRVNTHQAKTKKTPIKNYEHGWWQKSEWHSEREISWEHLLFLFVVLLYGGNIQKGLIRPNSYHLLLKVRQSRNYFFKLTFLPKNEQMNSTLLLCDLFSFVFWKKVKTPKRHFEINWPL